MSTAWPWWATFDGRGTRGSSTLLCRLGLAELTVLHGSVTIDGVSLTVNDTGCRVPDMLQVSLIDYTLRHTTLSDLAVERGIGSTSKPDMLGKYVQRLLRTH